MSSPALAAAIVALEGAVVLGLGVFVAVDTVVGRPADAEVAAVLAVITVLGGLGMLFVGRGLLHVRRWSRAPAVLAQILAITVAIPLVQAGRLAIGAPLVVAAVAGLALLFSPATTRALLGEPEARPEADGEPQAKRPDAPVRENGAPAKKARR